MGLNFEKVPKFGVIGHKILWTIGKKWFWGNSRTSGFSLFPPSCPVCTVGTIWGFVEIESLKCCAKGFKPHIGGFYD